MYRVLPCQQPTVGKGENFVIRFVFLFIYLPPAEQKNSIPIHIVHTLYIYLHIIRTLSSAEARVVCQNVYGVPRALYRHHRIGYTLYNTYMYIYMYAFSIRFSPSISLSLSLSLVSFTLSLTHSPCSLFLPSLQNVPVRTCIPSALLCAHISRISATEIVWPRAKDNPSGASGPGGSMCVFGLNSVYTRHRCASVSL